MALWLPRAPALAIPGSTLHSCLFSLPLPSHLMFFFVSNSAPPHNCQPTSHFFFWLTLAWLESDHRTFRQYWYLGSYPTGTKLASDTKQGRQTSMDASDPDVLYLTHLKSHRWNKIPQGHLTDIGLSLWSTRFVTCHPLPSSSFPLHFMKRREHSLL